MIARSAATTGVYDAGSHGASGSCLGVIGEDLSAGLDLGASFTDVPGGMPTWTFTDVTGNYSDDAGTVAIVISEAAPVCTISGYDQRLRRGQPRRLGLVPGGHG